MNQQTLENLLALCGQIPIGGWIIGGGLFALVVMWFWSFVWATNKTIDLQDKFWKKYLD